MSGISESQFYMWRTLFAMAHADNVITDEEIRFMAEALEDVPFSKEQREILNRDIKEPQDIVAMFAGISDQGDQARFFDFARELVWCDGEYGLDEQHIMLKLKKIHLEGVNVDDLVGKVDLQFEEELPPPTSHSIEKKDGRGIVSAFKRLFRS